MAPVPPLLAAAALLACAAAASPAAAAPSPAKPPPADKAPPKPPAPAPAPAPVPTPKLAGTASVAQDKDKDIFGPAFAPDGSSIVLAEGEQLLRFDPKTLARLDAKATRTQPALRTSAVVLHGASEDVAIDLAAAARIVIPFPKGYSECREPAFSADASRLSRYCENEDDSSAAFPERAVVQDARTGATVVLLDEFHTAAPIRAARITDSGNFVFWYARSVGAFEEIKSKVTGPETSSLAVMSPDEHALFTVTNRNWDFEDTTPAQVLDPKRGKVRYKLPYEIVRVYFSPDSQRFAAVHKKDNAKIDAVTIHRTDTGAVVATLPDRDVELVVFSADAHALLVRGSSSMKLYTGVP